MESPQIHPTALVHTKKIGARTRVWAFTNILEGAEIGSDCNICDRVFVEGRVKIGDRVTIKCGVSLWDGIIVEDDVFIGPSAAFTNDLYPRSRHYLREPMPTLIRRGASIGANATILAGVTVGTNAMVGAGAVVTKSVPPNAIVRGNPARIEGYVGPGGPVRIKADQPIASDEAVPPRVRDVRIIQMPIVEDLRGTLSFGEVGVHLPFEPKRYFLVYDVPSKDVRGEHAHKKLKQLLVCVRGSCRVVVDDGSNLDEFELHSPHLALYVPPMVWAVQYKYSSDATLMVLASEKYDGDDYIRNYDDFLKLIAERSDR